MNRLTVSVLLACLATNPAWSEALEENLRRLTQDYAGDPSFTEPVTFGIRVDDADWTVAATPAVEGEPADVTATPGIPEIPTFVYVTDAETFARIVAGDLHALTAMAQARASDRTAMQLDVVNGFEMNEAALRTFLSLSFHFFTTGQPEIVPLGPEHALPVHGGEALPIYYGDHLRTSWYGIAPGQHINADARDQVNDFPSLFVILDAGTARARLDGREMALEDDQAIYVPEGMSHEFWNPGEQRATLILIMFGENA